MRIIFIFILVCSLVGCNSSKLPTEKHSQYTTNHSYTFEDNQLKVTLQNPLQCPIRIWITSDQDYLQNKFNKLNPIELNSKLDTVLVFQNIENQNQIINFPSRLGSVSKIIEPIQVEFPFVKNKEYKIIQGNNTNYTHNSKYSKFAIDFNLKTNDTICSATDGFVVGVIDAYEFGGKGSQWRPFSNFITVYNSTSGIFFQYAHLVKNGSLVKLGDKIEAGQAIALSGNTGQSDGEHLHFNCLKPVNTNAGLESIPIEFVDGQSGIDLRKGDRVIQE